MGLGFSPLSVTKLTWVRDVDLHKVEDVLAFLIGGHMYLQQGTKCQTTRNLLARHPSQDGGACDACHMT